MSNLRYLINRISPIEYLEHHAAKVIANMATESRQKFNVGEQVRYVGEHYPELQNCIGVIQAGNPINRLIVVEFPGLVGSYHLYASDIRKLND